jgi:death-on-curing protein
LYYRLTGQYVEVIHDELLALYWPGKEPVDSGEYRSRELIDSAVNRPFQSAFGEEAFPTLYDKAAAFFHALACNHCLTNGNKRTAVVALDHFLTANGHCLIANNEEIKTLAEATASHNAAGVHFRDALANITAFLWANAPPLTLFQSVLSDPGQEDTPEFLEEMRILYDYTVESRREIIDEGAAVPVYADEEVAIPATEPMLEAPPQ